MRTEDISEIPKDDVMSNTINKVLILLWDYKQLQFVVQFTLRLKSCQLLQTLFASFM